MRYPTETKKMALKKPYKTPEVEKPGGFAYTFNSLIISGGCFLERKAALVETHVHCGHPALLAPTHTSMDTLACSRAFPD